MRPANWMLPLACAVIPAVAVHVAWRLSVAGGFIPDCLPHLEGCVSISRAARHGTGNTVFKALMLPCALLQYLHWREASRWVRAHHPEPGAGASLPALGLVAAVALATYTVVLGTEGAFYQWMRRIGITFYFGATLLAILACQRRLLQLGTQRRIARAMLALCAAMLALGVASTVASATVTDGTAKDRIENILEWQLGILLTGWFVLQAALWRRAPVGGRAGLS